MSPTLPTRISQCQAFRDGFAVALLNPKIAICTDTAYVMAADALGLRLQAPGWSHGRYLTAIMFIALGVYMAFGGANHLSRRSLQ